MDTQNNVIIVASKVNELLAGHNFVVGAKQLKKALKNGIASRVFLATNADPALTEPIAQMCGNYDVEVVWVRSMTDLGHACGIEVGAAAAATLRCV